MFTLKVGTVETYQDIEQNETRLRVPFQILDGEGALQTELAESFSLGTGEEEIKETLARHLAVFSEDFDRHEAGKAHQEALDQSQEVAGSISGLTL
jgi:hypothetical protein